MQTQGVSGRDALVSAPHPQSATMRAFPTVFIAGRSPPPLPPCAQRWLMENGNEANDRRQEMCHEG